MNRGFSGQRFMGFTNARVKGYYFFYCAEPLATSASIQNIRTNIREYYVKRLKIDFIVRNNENSAAYIMAFVLNVPNNYVPEADRFSNLPNHKIPECVLYYDLIKSPNTYGNFGAADIRIDIKKPFNVKPSHKLAFVFYLFARNETVTSEGTAEVFFEVN